MCTKCKVFETELDSIEAEQDIENSSIRLAKKATAKRLQLI